MSPDHGTPRRSGLELLQQTMRFALVFPVALLGIVAGCVSPDTDDRPAYAADDRLTRSWASCLAANAGDMDDGVASAWTIGQAVADACAPDLLSAFRRKTTAADRRKAYAVTAEKAVALIEANRRDRASGPENAPGIPNKAAPSDFGMSAERT